MLSWHAAATLASVSLDVSEEPENVSGQAFLASNLALLSTASRTLWRKLFVRATQHVPQLHVDPVRHQSLVPRLYPVLQGVTEEPGNHPVAGIKQ